MVGAERCYLERVGGMEGGGGCTWGGAEAMMDDGDSEGDNMYCTHTCLAVLDLEKQMADRFRVSPKRHQECGQNFCSRWKMSCIKPISEFPNSCEGQTEFGYDHHLALYAYRKEVGQGPGSEIVLETRLRGHEYEGQSLTCSAAYKITFGTCFGLTEESVGTRSADPAIAPPELRRFPHVGPTTTRTTLTRTTLTATTQTSTSHTATSTTVTTTTRTTTTATTTEPPSVAGGVTAWLLAVLTVVALGAGFYTLKKRRNEEEQQLRNAREIELPEANRRL